jgi:hypothetical protein
VALIDVGEHRLRDLQSSAHVFQVDAPGLAQVFPPLRSLDTLPGNLPRQLTLFVVREAEIVADEGVPFWDMAQAIGRHLGLPTG